MQALQIIAKMDLQQLVTLGGTIHNQPQNIQTAYRTILLMRAQAQAQQQAEAVAGGTDAS